MAFFILTRFFLVKYSRAFVERLSQGTSSLASRITTVSLDIYIYIYIYIYISRLTVVSREAKEEVPRDERTGVFYKNKSC